MVILPLSLDINSGAIFPPRDLSASTSLSSINGYFFSQEGISFLTAIPSLTVTPEVAPG
jgi:hypothetical protein